MAVYEVTLNSKVIHRGDDCFKARACYWGQVDQLRKDPSKTGTVIYTRNGHVILENDHKEKEG